MSWKLTAFIYEGNPITDTHEEDMWEITSEPLKVEQTVSAGYQDITSISNWEKYWENTCNDYKCFRNRMIEFMLAGNPFSGLTQAEKEIVAKNFCVAKADRDSLFTVQQQIEHGREFHKKSVLAREKRKMYAEAEVYNRILDGIEQADLMNDVSLLLQNYHKFGIEGTLEGDVAGVFDYIESRAGTPYENAGLLQKTYTVEGMTVAQLSQRLMDIMKNGLY
jgi:hypothetical protein